MADQTPPPPLRGPKRDRRLSGASSRSPSFGTATARPNRPSATIAMSRVAESPSPTPSTTVASPTIVIVKVSDSPSTMPSGRRRPPVAPALSSAGSTGSTQGLSAVPAPATKAKRTRSEMANQLYAPATSADHSSYSVGMPLTVEIWSDVVCPWCYLGKRRFEDALARFEHRDEVTVLWRSFELDPEAERNPQGSSAERLAAKYGMSVESAQSKQEEITALPGAQGLEDHLDP